MPEVSRFFGIIIAMYYRDHDPPHFHVRYGDEKALIAIESLSVLRGRLSPRALGMVTEWDHSIARSSRRTGTSRRASSR